MARSTSPAIFLASDQHFGAPTPAASLARERQFVRWLDTIQPRAQALYILGDLFDFWFEYRRAVPRGFVRVLGKLAEFADAGIPVRLFTGNHDLWYDTYFPEQLGIPVFRDPQFVDFFGKKFYLHHGDGLGPGDEKYKLMKRVVTHPLSRWLFARLHPNFGISLAQSISNRSPKFIGSKRDHYYGEEEFLYQHAQEVLRQHPDIDAFVFGHRHLMVRETVESADLIFLGDWIHFFSYLEVRADGWELKQYLDD